MYAHLHRPVLTIQYCNSIECWGRKALLYRKIKASWMLHTLWLTKLSASLKFEFLKLFTMQRLDHLGIFKESFLAGNWSQDRSLWARISPMAEQWFSIRKNVRIGNSGSPKMVSQNDLSTQKGKNSPLEMTGPSTIRIFKNLRLAESIRAWHPTIASMKFLQDFLDILSLNILSLDICHKTFCH